MPDTCLGDFPDIRCSDCGEIGSEFKHWGPLVPDNKHGNFCAFCWVERDKSYRKGEKPKPLGVQPPGIPQEFSNKKIRVKTQSGAVYELTPAGKPNEISVLRDSKNIGFKRARVLCLSVGKVMFLKPRDGSDLSLWRTTPVVSVEQY
ncbi:MAG: hypothetical protein M1334_04665 [Patescibacteria group bacterium]|nr:hypothetical protein [Patescibacteria group bacterium]